MDNTQIKEGLNLDILERMQNESPIAVYIKTIRAKLGIFIFNPVTNKPEERLLAGDPEDPNVDIEDITAKIWTESAHLYFKNVNKRAIEEGKLVPYESDAVRQTRMTNAITDEEIEQILNEPFFTLMNRLNDFTSAVPVERILRKAKELNRPHKTIERVYEKLQELQEAEGADDQAKRLDEYYKNLEA